MSLNVMKYVGRVVDIIYVDRRGRISKRTVFLRLVKDGTAHAYCFARMAPRRFQVRNILAVEVKRKRAV